MSADDIVTYGLVVRAPLSVIAALRATISDNEEQVRFFFGQYSSEKLRLVRDEPEES